MTADGRLPDPTLGLAKPDPGAFASVALLAGEPERGIGPEIARGPGDAPAEERAQVGRAAHFVAEAQITQPPASGEQLTRASTASQRPVTLRSGAHRSEPASLRYEVLTLHLAQFPQYLSEDLLGSCPRTGVLPFKK